MTQPELDTEYTYVLQERLGMLCGDAKPTPEQVAMARLDADRAVRKLERLAEQLAQEFEK